MRCRYFIFMLVMLCTSCLQRTAISFSEDTAGSAFVPPATLSKIVVSAQIASSRVDPGVFEELVLPVTLTTGNPESSSEWFLYQEKDFQLAKLTSGLDLLIHRDNSALLFASTDGTQNACRVMHPETPIYLHDWIKGDVSGNRSLSSVLPGKRYMVRLIESEFHPLFDSISPLRIAARAENGTVLASPIGQNTSFVNTGFEYVGLSAVYEMRLLLASSLAKSTRGGSEENLLVCIKGYEHRYDNPVAFVALEVEYAQLNHDGELGQRWNIYSEGEANRRDIYSVLTRIDLALARAARNNVKKFIEQY